MGLMPWLRRRLEAFAARRMDPPRRSARLRYRSIYILPTAQGSAFGAMLLVMWLGAINYSNSLAFALTFLLAGTGMAAMHNTFRNLLGLQVTALPPEPGFAGGNVGLRYRLDNPGRLGRVAVELRCAETRGAPVDVGASATALVPLPAPRRGVLRPGRVTVTSRYPAALFRAWSWLALEQEALVYPAPEAGRVPAPQSLGGQSRGSGGGPGDTDFGGLRRYRPGDPLRRVAWKATHARELQVKEFVGDAPERLWLDYAAAGLQDPEAALSRLCRWVLDAEQAHRVYGLRLPGMIVPPGSGPAHRRRCLEALARF